MRRTEQIGVEARALEFLNEQSAGTQGLYKHMTDMLTHGRSTNESDCLRAFYKWVIFAKQPLTIFQIQQLMALEDIETTDFDVEKEVKTGPSSR